MKADDRKILKLPYYLRVIVSSVYWLCNQNYTGAESRVERPGNRSNGARRSEGRIILS